MSKNSNPLRSSNKTGLRRVFLAASILLIAAAALVFFITLNGAKNTWYVAAGYEEHWVRILREIPPPEKFRLRVYRGEEKLRAPGIIISTRREQIPEKTKTYFMLSFDLEYEGAYVLALDPWMIFRKHTNPGLTADRVRQPGGSGLLLIPGKEAEARQAWAARLIQEGPGKFPDDPAVWQEAEDDLFSRNLFPPDSQYAEWQNVLLSLLGNNPAWVYAPISRIRQYPDAQTSILEATAFPEDAPNGQSSLQAKLLWAIPRGSDKQKELLQPAIDWLKDPATQTSIANELQWVPAAPYAQPFNPVSMSAYLLWLTTANIYEVY
jgi:hypothetical protein